MLKGTKMYDSENGSCEIQNQKCVPVISKILTQVPA